MAARPPVKRAMPGILGLRPYEPGKPLEELAREYGIRDAIKLASNENPLGPGPAARAAVARAAADLGRYPDGHAFTLRRVLSERLGVAPEAITFGNGSNDVLDLVARVFLGPCRNAVYSEHAFAVYPIVTQAVGAEHRVVPAHDGRRGPAYGHDLDAMRERVDEHTGVVFIANPNNPTGTWVRDYELEDFLDSLPRQVVVVLDEAYREYVEEPQYPDGAAWLARYPNLVVTRTFSKIHGLAALRVGYALSHPDLAGLLERVRQPFNVNALGLAAAEAALDDAEHLWRSRELNRQEMARWVEACRARGWDYIPSVGNFITLDTGRPAGPVYEALLREGVIVRPIAGYGLPNHLRITLGLPEENLRAIAALERVLAEAPA